VPRARRRPTCYPSGVPEPPPDIDTVRARLAEHEPQARPADDTALWAATALVLAPNAAGAEVAFIKRVTRSGDRWSGQMALPGGKRDPGDPNAAFTARREAREEVGLELADPIGRLDDVRGRAHWGLVATFVFTLDHRPDLQPDPAEVAAALWIPLEQLLSAEAAFRYAWGGLGRFPAIRHGEHVIWGLTHRIIGSLADALGVPLPPPR
jgi:8-oxo-dGTP pyrophosphatase MutT (NUDIX family)